MKNEREDTAGIEGKSKIRLSIAQNALDSNPIQLDVKKETNLPIR